MLANGVLQYRRQNVFGISAMVLGVALFSCVDAILKLLLAYYPPIQVAGLRGLVALPILVLWIHRRRAWGSLLRVRVSLQFLRGCLAVGMLVLLTVGFRDLPLANAYTLYFVAPLLMTLLAGPVLGERVSGVHWVGVAGGLLGVVIALRPDTEGLVDWAGLSVLAAALCYAGVAVLTRLGSRTDSRESLMFWMALMMALVPCSFALPGWVVVRSDHLWLLVLLAVTGFMAQLALTEAFRQGQASVVAPFEYTALAWGIGVDWFIWSVLPTRYTLVGGGVILAFGLYVLRHEISNKRQACQQAGGQ